MRIASQLVALAEAGGQDWGGESAVVEVVPRQGSGAPRFSSSYVTPLRPQMIPGQMEAIGCISSPSMKA